MVLLLKKLSLTPVSNNNQKKFTNPKIILLNIELELKSEKESAEIRIENPE